MKLRFLKENQEEKKGKFYKFIEEEMLNMLINREKKNGQSVFLQIIPCNCIIEKLLINKDRTKTIGRRVAAKAKA
jgi:hypothetical protein